MKNIFFILLFGLSLHVSVQATTSSFKVFSNHNIISYSNLDNIFEKDFLLVDSCQADFIYAYISDSSVQFKDVSSCDVIQRFWNFGDGSSSTLEQPIHTYDNGGLYEVELIIVTADSIIYSIMQYVEIGYQDFIVGIVNAGFSSLPQGTLKLFIIEEPEDSDSYIFVDSASITNGFFSLPYANNNNEYVLYAIPKIDVPEYHFPEYFPSYYGGKVYWEDAITIMPDEGNIVEIDLAKRDGVFYGHATISGTIDIGSADSVGGNTICVFLLDTQMNPLRYDFVKQDGYFIFDKIPYGDYYLLVDKIGTHAEPLSVLVNESDPYRKVVFNITEEGITSVGDISLNINEVNIYPNPFATSICLGFDKLLKKEIPITIVDLTGRVVFSKIINSNNQKIKIDLSFLNNGIYILQMPNISYKILKK